MSALDEFEEQIRDMVTNTRYTIQDVSDELNYRFGPQRGFSYRNISRFCNEHDIHRFAFATMDRDDIEDIAYSAVEKLGPTYGRKMFTGYLRSLGLSIGEKLAGAVLKGLSPLYVAERRSGVARQVNPLPYFAEYAGHKIHLDQNEKLKDFGVTHVMACDGYSGKIVGMATMPVKNNLIIYEEVYRKACLQYGLFDTVRVDHGKEFYLCLYQQENLEQYRTNVRRSPFIQTSSKQNHAIERLWVEINGRVNYPIKSSLQMMKENGEIDMADDMVKFCVSQLSIQLSRIACENMVGAWNAHSIPRKGIPNELFEMSCNTSHVPYHLLPSSEVVSARYMADGGKLTQWPIFGKDPLETSFQDIAARDHMFIQHFPTLEPIMSQLVNRNDVHFRAALLCLIDITDRLS